MTVANKTALVNTKVEEALAYAALDWPLIPLHSVQDGQCSCCNKECDRKGKHPRIKDWNKQGSCDLQQVNEWWETWPDANIGVLTGAASGLVVIDGDAKHGIDSVDALEKLVGELPVTVMAKTGSGGVHAFFKHPGFHVPNSRSVLAAGVDVQADDGQVVLPPSANRAGSYEWIHDPFSTPLAELPQSLRDRLGNPVRHDNDGVIPEGQRNDALTRLGGKLRSQDLDKAEIFQVLSATNTRKCEPPLSQEEVEGIAASVTRYPAGDQIPKVVFQPVSARQFCEQVEEDEIDYLLGPFLPRGSRLILAGHAGHGKTTLAYQMTRALITGEGFLGYQSTADCRVLMIDAEQSKKTIRRRLRAAGLDSSEDVDVVEASGLRLDGNASDLQTLTNLVAGYDVVVLDPLYRLFAGDMNDGQAFSPVIDTLEAWRKTHGTTVVLLTHYRKRQNGYSSGPRLDDIFGTASVGWTADQALGIERRSDGKARVHFLKDRDGELPVGEHLDLIYNPETGFTIDPFGSDKKLTSIDHVRTLLHNHPGEFTRKEIVEKLKPIAGRKLNDKTIENCLNDLGAVGEPDGVPKTKQHWSLPMDEDDGKTEKQNL